MVDRNELLRFSNQATEWHSEWVNPFDKIEELLTCAICLDRYKHPKVLPCQHSFCLEPCLEGLVDVTRRTVKCPECRVEHVMPQDGSRGLPTNYTLAGFLEIHLRATEQNAVEFEAYMRRYNMERCKVCNEKAVLEICAHCNRKICPECLENHIEMLKRDLGRLLNQVKRISCRINDWSEAVSHAIDSLSVQAESVKEEIREWMRRLTKQFKKREEILMAEVDAFCSTESRIMKSVRQNFDLESCNICEACTRLDAYLKGERSMSLQEAVLYKQMFIEGLEHLRSFSPDIDVICNKRFRFVINTSTASLANMIAHFGEIQVSNFLTNVSLQNTDLVIPRFLRFALESDASETNHDRTSATKSRDDHSDDKRDEYQNVRDGRKSGNLYQASNAYESHRQSERISADVSDVMANSPWLAIHRTTQRENDVDEEDEEDEVTSPEPEVSPEVSTSLAGTSSGSGEERTARKPRIIDDADEELNMRIANIRKNFEMRKRELDKQVRTIKEQKSKSPACTTDSSPEVESGSDEAGQDMDDHIGVQPIRVQIYTSALVSHPSSVAVEEASFSSKPTIRIEDSVDRSTGDEQSSSCLETSHEVLLRPARRSSNDRKSKLPVRSGCTTVDSDEPKPARERRSTAEVRESSPSTDIRAEVTSKVHSKIGVNQAQEERSKIGRSLKSPNLTCKAPMKRYTYTNNAPKNNYARKGRMVLKFGQKGDGPAEFNWPRGIALTPNGKEIVVCDSSNHRLQILDVRGKFLRTFGKYGNGVGQFDSLAGVCVNQYGQVVVTDRYNHRIQMLDSSGRVLRVFGSHGQTNGRFNSPWGVTMDLQGFIYVCDKDNHRVQILQADGSYVGKFGDLGSHEGQFQHPHFITSNRRSHLIVSDTNNHRIQVFDHKGQFLFTFGTEGYHEGQFKYPKGVAVDDQEFIFVADSGNSRIQIFYPDGRFFAQFGTWGSNDGEMRAIEDVKVTLDGLIIVSDRENHRIQIF